MNASEIRSLLSDSPEFETALEALLDIDRERKTWTFDDIPLDSGTFGELVGEGVVEKVDGEYRLADPEAVERALGGETVEADDSGGVDVSMPELDWTAAGLLGLVLVVAVAVRIANYPSVFRDRVVFTGNDPYYYVYAVEEGLRNGWSFSELPAGLANGEPLTIVQLLYAAEFAGGLDSHTAILAWMPVLVGVATVLVTYLFAYEVAEDRRVALASAF
ncbi:MAG: laminin G, partial [Natronomonas sp.]